MADSYIICSSRARRSVRKLLDTPSYMIMTGLCIMYWCPGVRFPVWEWLCVTSFRYICRRWAKKSHYMCKGLFNTEFWTGIIQTSYRHAEELWCTETYYYSPPSLCHDQQRNTCFRGKDISTWAIHIGLVALNANGIGFISVRCSYLRSMCDKAQEPRAEFSDWISDRVYCSVTPYPTKL